jgi:hypothetical protein
MPNPDNSDDTRWEVLATDFNDPSILIDHPRGAKKLTDFAKYNLNDMTRISIGRDGAWIKD